MPAKKRTYKYNYTLQRKVNRKLKRKYSSAKKKARLIGLAVLSVLISSLIIVSISVYKFMTAPFTSASSADFSDTERVFNKDYTNIAIIQIDDLNDKSSSLNKLTLLYLDSINNRYTIYHIPVDVSVKYPLNYENGPFSEMYRIGNSDEGRGIYFIKKAILKNFAVNVDGYAVLDTEGAKKLSKLAGKIDEHDLSLTLRLRKIPKIPSLVMTFREVALTNLKVADLLDLFKFIRNTSNTSSEVVTLNKYQVLDESNWDELWQSNLGIYGVQKEAIKVFVVNGSRDPKIPGLASWGGRVVENMGADVLELENAFSEFDENTIVTDDFSLKTVQKLSEVLEIDKIIHVNDLDKSARHNPQFFRAPISLVVTSW